MTFLLLLTDADSEKLLDRLSVVLKSFVPIKQLIRPLQRQRRSDDYILRCNVQIIGQTEDRLLIIKNVIEI